MANNLPPATVKELLARVTASAARIQAHRDAMAAVAAAAKATPKPAPETGVTKP